MPPREGDVRVMFVDDDPSAAQMAATFMERAVDGLVVTPETDPTNVLGRLESGDFHCVVSTYDMPGVDGLDLLGVVRSNYPDLPFVLFTANGTEDVASEAISAGVTDYVTKDSGTNHYGALATRIGQMVESEEASASDRRVTPR